MIPCIVPRLIAGELFSYFFSMLLLSLSSFRRPLFFYFYATSLHSSSSRLFSLLFLLNLFPPYHLAG